MHYIHGMHVIIKREKYVMVKKISEKTHPPHQALAFETAYLSLSVCYTQNVFHYGFSYMYGMCFSHIHPHYLLLLPLHSCWFLPLPTSSLLLPVSVRHSEFHQAYF